MLGRVGVWAGGADEWPVAELRRAVAVAEQLGYGALWFGETGGREAMAQAALLLAAGERIAVVCGMADVYARDAVATAAGVRTLEEAFPGRFLAALWESHPTLAQEVRGHAYRPAVEMLRAYLEGLDAAPFGPPGRGGGRVPRLVSALGREVLEVAAESADGALVFGLPVAHTREARRLLGPEALLAVVQLCVLAPDAPDPAAARRAATGLAAAAMPNRRELLRASGHRQLDPPGPELVDALVAHGDAAAVAARIREHREAGADHVALHVLSLDGPDGPDGSNGPGVPERAWARLAAELGPETMGRER
ncbi:LLM class flavin-dependent oxidoreductase [Kitasatospora phosalacinea]|uniref:LLM class flavin-dependent oxidoreductase n=1 Tax=Kitasatospora phosalacinea TaxID=2065 RepID=UPI00255486D9|nr:LLM class flavin-dependent oxidoreductase [Kitasatospora phosalacinea]